MSMAMIPQNGVGERITNTCEPQHSQADKTWSDEQQTKGTFWFTNRILEKTCSVAAAKLPFQGGYITFGDPYCLMETDYHNCIQAWLFLGAKYFQLYPPNDKEYIVYILHKTLK